MLWRIQTYQALNLLRRRFRHWRFRDSTNIDPISLGSTEATPTYTDIMGKTYSNAADRDRANLGYQQASYQQGSQALEVFQKHFQNMQVLEIEVMKNED